LSAGDIQIKSIIEQLNNFKPTLTQLCTTTGLGVFSKIEIAIGRVIEAAREVNVLDDYIHISSDLKQLYSVA